MRDRVQTLLDRYNLSVSEFAEKIGVQKSSISHLISGRNMPSFAFCEKLAQTFPEVNMRWFISGQGAFLEDDSSDSADKSNLDLFSSLEEVVTETDVDSKRQRVERIIVFYDDNTFKEYNPR
ncbi:helix-turn-helix domain-containing protein [Halosquirtibacter laminarini]|uniref:Helix-turn-helix domain-containing protein n=1 Tax=Halosquirtibacter laminarini TaxID=3374600 RepID=A0AC61NMF2_9BACT|nr:helix-turn-helix domain-containing protein [Prolixibacteraceae bacterium]